MGGWSDGMLSFGYNSVNISFNVVSVTSSSHAPSDPTPSDPTPSDSAIVPVFR